MRSLITFTLALLLCAAPALAAEPTAAALYDKAEQRFNEADFEEAAALLSKAARSTRDAKLLGKVHLKLGIIHAVMGDEKKASAAFEEALKKEPTVELDPRQVKPEVVALLEQARGRLEGILSVLASRRDARVVVDGKPVGEVPYLSMVPVGKHVVEVHFPTYSRTKKVVVYHRVKTEVFVRFLKHLGQGGSAKQPPEPPPREEASAPYDPLHMPGVLTWVGLGLTVGALGTGVGFSVTAHQQYGEFQDLLASGVRDDARRQQLVDDIQSNSDTANIMYGVGGGLAAVTVALYFLEPLIWGDEGEDGADRKQATAPRLRLAPLLGAVQGAQLRLNF